MALAAMPGQIQAKNAPELTTVQEIRALTPDQARRATPVLLHGVVTALSGFKNSFFVQDATAGISVDRTDNADVHAGDQVEVVGVSGPGMFAPVVLASHVRVLGHVSPPPPRQVTYSDLIGGQQDSQWIQVRGVIHSAQISELFGHRILILILAFDGQSIKVYLQDFSGVDYSKLIDSTARVQGVCSTEFNQKRQFVGLGMFVPNRGDIEVVQPARADPFATPMIPVRSVLQFGQESHRVRVAGIATYQIPGRVLYLQDGNDGIRIQSSSTDLVEQGRRVEAVGFPAVGEYGPILKDGFFRVVGSAAPVAPLRIDAKDAIVHQDGFYNAPYDQQLVQLRGEVRESHVHGGQRVWILRQGGEIFEASTLR